MHIKKYISLYINKNIYNKIVNLIDTQRHSPSEFYR